VRGGLSRVRLEELAGAEGSSAERDHGQPAQLREGSAPTQDEVFLVCLVAGHAAKGTDRL
jgi:hypothetical protein